MPDVGPLIDDGWSVYLSGTALVAYHGETDKARVWVGIEGDAAPVGPRMHDAAEFLGSASLWLAASRAHAHPDDRVIQAGLDMAEGRLRRDG